MLKDLIDKKLIEGRAVVGFYQSNVLEGQDDDVTLFNDEGNEICKLHMLRQQLDAG